MSRRTLFGVVWREDGRPEKRLISGLDDDSVIGVFRTPADCADRCLGRNETSGRPDRGGFNDGD